MSTPNDDGGSPRDVLAVTEVGHNDSFTNQGQIDWVSLASATISTSVEVMARFSGAGIDPFTTAVGQAIASKFTMSKLGMHRLDSVVQGLACFSGVGQAVYFGFGVKHVARTLAQTTEGATFIMLCSALAEAHSVRLSARVLFELTRLYSSNTTPVMTPSLRQWLLVVEACCGLLSSSPFGVVVEQFMSLAGDVHVTNNDERDRAAGDPADIAAALRAIGRISCGDLLTVTIVGGAECGWIAALAHWFFELAVEVRSPEGVVLQSAGSPSLTKGITVVFTDAKEHSLHLSTESYMIRNLNEGVFHKDGGETQRLSGRVPWDHALQKTFGKTVSKLLEQSHVLGSAIGSAAGIFSAISKAEAQPHIREQVTQGWCGYDESSYGRGFLNHIVNVFPEMTSIQEISENAIGQSCVDAVASYKIALSRLTTICRCWVCGDPECTLVPDSSVMSSFCIPLLCEVIIRTAWQLSLYQADTLLQPSRAGLQQIYEEHISVYKACRFGVQGNKPSEMSLCEQLGFEKAFQRACLILTGRSTYHTRGGPLIKFSPLWCPLVSVSILGYFEQFLIDLNRLGAFTSSQDG